MGSGESVEPRPGLLGYWDRFVGPGASPTENVGTVGLGVLGLLVGGRNLGRRAHRLTFAMIATDLWGGAWCNNTPAAVRWYGRPGQTAVDHLRFAGLHVHPFVVAAIEAREGGDRRWLRYGFAHYGYLMTATALVRACRGRARTAAAAATTAGGIALDARLGRPRIARWFAPLYYVKLLFGHAGGSWY